MLMVSVANVLLPTLNRLGAARQEVQDPDAEVGIQSQGPELCDELGRDNIDCVICGSVGAVCELEWVQGVWDHGVDVSHDQSFKAFHGYRCECFGVVFRDIGGLLETCRYY